MSKEHEEFHSHPLFHLPTSDTSGVEVGHIHGTQGMSPDEIRHRVADEHGKDPSEVTLFNAATGEVSRAPEQFGRSRSYGFSKWGATWEPTGPGANPSLN